MPPTDAESSMHDVSAAALGCLAGVLMGGGLGACIVVLLGNSSPGMSAIVMLHSVLAMVVMGAWTAPSLLRPQESQTP
jgi:hypothetical protein